MGGLGLHSGLLHFDLLLTIVWALVKSELDGLLYPVRYTIRDVHLLSISKSLLSERHGQRLQAILVDWRGRGQLSIENITFIFVTKQQE